MHRDLEACFPPGALVQSFLLFERDRIERIHADGGRQSPPADRTGKAHPDSEAFQKRMGELRERMKHYEQYRLYPEMPDWEVMAFIP
jgi:hypothetical protein